MTNTITAPPLAPGPLCAFQRDQVDRDECTAPSEALNKRGFPVDRFEDFFPKLEFGFGNPMVATAAPGNHDVSRHDSRPQPQHSRGMDQIETEKRAAPKSTGPWFDTAAGATFGTYTL